MIEFQTIKYMNNFIANYGKILETLQQIEKKMNFLNQIRLPRLSDLELIAVDLTSEYMGIDSEHQLFRVLPKELKDKIERSVYNRRKRKYSISGNKYANSCQKKPVRIRII